MALGRFVIGATVTLPAGTPAADANGFGLVTWAGAGTGATLQWAGGLPATFFAGQVIVADSSAPGANPTGAQQLYTALTAASANLRPFVDGSDSVGHYGLSN